MDLEQPKQQNKYIEYIKNNKYTLYFTAAIAGLLILIIIMIIIITSSSSNKKSLSNITPIQQTPISNSSQIPSSINNVSPTENTISVTTPNPTEAAAIESQTQPQITPAASYDYSDIKEFGDNWATADITNQQVGGGAIILQKINGSWKVIAGPGTFFPPSYLQSLNLPQAVINSFGSSSISPSISQ